MSIHIHLRGPGLNMITLVKDDALDALLRLLQDHRDAQGETPHFPKKLREARPPADRELVRQQLKMVRRKLAESPQVMAAAKKLKALDHPPFDEHADLSFPDKILLLGAWTEARKQRFMIQGPALAEAFFQCGQTPPANPKRDVMTAVQSGWISLGMYPNPNRAAITAEGWQRITGLLGD